MCSLTIPPRFALWKPENPEATPMPKLTKRIVDAALASVGLLDGARASKAAE